jgi:hypothetical protein
VNGQHNHRFKAAIPQPSLKAPVFVESFGISCLHQLRIGVFRPFFSGGQQWGRFKEGPWSALDTGSDGRALYPEGLGVRKGNMGGV